MSPTYSSVNGRLTGNSPLVQHTERCFWEEPRYLVLIAFGRCRPTAGVVSLAGLCFIVVAGLRTGYVGMECVT
jgi:hypothetical protein